MRAQFLFALLGHAAAQNLVALLNGDFEELDGAVPSAPPTTTEAPTTVATTTTEAGSGA